MIVLGLEEKFNYRIGGLLVLLINSLFFSKRGVAMKDEEEFLIIEGEREIIIISETETTIIKSKRGLCWGE